MKNIILVGMPGSGKSTLGILLAKKIHYGYIDSDSVIVAKEGKLFTDHTVFFLFHIEQDIVLLVLYQAFELVYGHPCIV